jgi:hydroxymethylglutaryl-CoA reductase (NADPH)
MDEYLHKLRNGTVKLYALEKELAPQEAVAVRRRYIEEETGSHLRGLETFPSLLSQ